MVCKFCGSPIADGAMFCTNCGKTTTETASSVNLNKEAEPINPYAQTAQPSQAAYAQPNQAAYSQPVNNQAYAQPAYTQQNTYANNGYSNANYGSYGQNNGVYNVPVAPTPTANATPVLVLGIVSLACALFGYFSLATIICGIIALTKAGNIKKTTGSLPTKGKVGMGLAIGGFGVTALWILYAFIIIVSSLS